MITFRSRARRLHLHLHLIIWAGFTYASPSAHAEPAGPRLGWVPCGEEGSGRECAVAQVPLDYDDPEGPQISLVLARFPATAEGPKRGSVFVNPGGPGGSGVGTVLGGFGQALSELLGGEFDIVGFDPRGVGASTPLRCFDTFVEFIEFFADTPVFPHQAGQYRPYFSKYRDFAARCLGRGEGILRHMSTADVARDLDRLRALVGDEALTYLGFSYGSFIGSTYANLFPEKVRALAIDGVLNPRLWGWGLQILSDRLATQEVFEEFLRLCTEAGPACAFDGPEGPRDRFERLADAVRRDPLVLADGFLYTYDILIEDVVGSMYRPGAWVGPEGLAALLDALDGATGGNPEAKVHVLSIRRALWEGLSSAESLSSAAGLAFSGRQEAYFNFVEAYSGNHCGDAEYPSRFGVILTVDRFARSGSRFGPYWWWGSAGPCSGWPVARDRYTGPWKTRTSAPVLVVGNFFDPATDYQGAVETARLLRDSVLLSYSGWGHTAFSRSGCVQQFVVDYLREGELPPEGTVCPAEPNPFLVGREAQSQARASRDWPMGRPHPSPQTLGLVRRPRPL